MNQNSYNPNHILLRTYTLSGEIDENTSKNVIDFISMVNDMDSTINPPNRKPINIILNSMGGSMYDGFAIIGAIEQSKTPVHITCLGSAMSMALAILASGHYRVGHSLSSYMYHECLDYISYEKMSVIKENLDEGNRIMEIYDEYLISKTKLTRRKLNKVKKDKSDWYFGVDEALEYGLINEIK
jgi:ATP-dependent Clp protease protease subunit